MQIRCIFAKKVTGMFREAGICFRIGEVRGGERVEKELQALVHLMMARNASDAHFVLRGGHLHFHLRCLGVMDHQDDGLFDARLFQYLKYAAHLDLGDLARPQSGNLCRTYQGQQLQFRFSLLCTNEMQTGVLRLLDQERFDSLKDICHDGKQRLLLQALCQGRGGLALFSGPTGSGKTTTLHVLLKQAALVYQRQVITLEDPIEIQDDAYVQLQINERNGFTYEVGIEQLLRHDPDILMIGEIRSEKTAQMALRAALSGHSVFSTVHAKSCQEVFARMEEFGIASAQLTAALSFVSTQRLLRTREGKGRACYYEILCGEALSEYCRTRQLPKGHETMDVMIQKAYRMGEITKEAWQYECALG